MKNQKLFLFAFILLIFSLLFAGCTKNSDAVVSSTEEMLVKSPWFIDYYFDSQDMTSSYSSSRLLFSSTGVVGYQSNGQTIVGKWSSSVDVSNNEMVDLQFDTNNADVMALNKSWKLVE
ncbi:MAG TPA: hypothetical protein VGI82_09625, partial [Chitinophagaceae bacterium]